MGIDEKSCEIPCPTLSPSACAGGTRSHTLTVLPLYLHPATHNRMCGPKAHMMSCSWTLVTVPELSVGIVKGLSIYRVCLLGQRAGYSDYW